MTSTIKDSELYVKASSRSYITTLPLSSLSIDPQLQRLYVKQSHVKNIVDNFNPDALGVLEVSQRLSGMNHVLDGGTRMTAMRILRKQGVLEEDYQVVCKVFVGLTTAQEASLFALLNNKEKVSRVDLFRIKTKAGDPAALAIATILENNGWILRVGGAEHSFAAVAALESVYNHHPVSAEKTMRTLTRAWDYKPATVNNSLVRGLGAFYSFYGDAADMERVISKLSGFKNGPKMFLAAAQARKDTIKGTTENAVAGLIPELYNVGLSTRALPPWPRNGRRDKNAPPVVNTLDKMPSLIIVEENTVRIPDLEADD